MNNDLELFIAGLWLSVVLKSLVYVHQRFRLDEEWNHWKQRVLRFCSSTCRDAVSCCGKCSGGLTVACVISRWSSQIGGGLEVNLI